MRIVTAWDVREVSKITSGIFNEITTKGEN
jgi:hypothetical protein